MSPRRVALSLNSRKASFHYRVSHNSVKNEVQTFSCLIHDRPISPPKHIATPRYAATNYKEQFGELGTQVTGATRRRIGSSCLNTIMLPTTYIVHAAVLQPAECLKITIHWCTDAQLQIIRSSASYFVSIIPGTIPVVSRYHHRGKRLDSETCQTSWLIHAANFGAPCSYANTQTRKAAYK